MSDYRYSDHRCHGNQTDGIPSVYHSSCHEPATVVVTLLGRQRVAYPDGHVEESDDTYELCAVCAQHWRP